MRNLVLLQSRLHQFKFVEREGSQHDRVVGFVSIDTNTYNGITEEGTIFCLDLKRDEVTKCVDIEKTYADVLTPSARVIAAFYVAELESLCIATDLGDIITYHVFDGSCESVAVVQEGLKAMSWSPDQELVVFATGNDTLLVLSKDFEKIEEVDINQDPTATNRSSATLESTNSTKLDEHAQSCPPTISWRADGQFFAVNNYDSTNDRRWIRVWERANLRTVHSKSEPIDGIDATCSYKPDGSIIASHQFSVKHNETRIIFTERNGLQHYDFMLCKNRARVTNVQWNAGNDLLCVTVQLPETNEYVVQLWYRNNYHWYLKQQFHSGEPSCVQWDAESPHRLHIHTVGGSYTCYDFCWDHAMSIGVGVDNPCIMSVIDGQNLLLTPMRYALVPPPMSADKLTFSHPIDAVSFGPQKTLAVQLSTNQVHFYEYNTEDKKPPKFGLPPTKKSELTLSEELRHLTLVGGNLFVGVAASKAGQTERLKFVQIDTNQEWETSYFERILRITYHQATNNIFVQTESGTVYIQDRPTDDQVPIPDERPEFSFQQPCQWMQATNMAGEEEGDEQTEVLIGLSTRGVLNIQSNIAVSNCSSFTLHGDQHLLFTTVSHQLRIVPLTLSVSDALELASSTASSKYDQGFREVERGGKLTCAIPEDVRVVLQMPRGNLEGIYPKALLLDHLRNLLNRCEYGQALVLMRKHIVDMNLIYDHSPTQFLSHVSEFVQQVDNADYLNLFLSTLTNGNVIQEKYHGYRTEQSKPVRDDGKIKAICLAVREALQTVDRTKFMTTIITTYAKCNPPQLEEALQLIREMRVNEMQGGKQGSAESALKYLIFLADVNKLYDVALGMYDFELVLMVAQKSQKDPREYLPFLANLQKMEKYYQRFSIDSHLNRWESALRNLAQAGEQYQEECIKLVREKELFTLGMELFGRVKESPLRARLFETYGDNLASKQKHQQAAYAYVQAETWEKAMNAFKEAGDYQMTFTVAKHRLHISDMKQVARETVNVLIRLHKVQDAALVLREYLRDPEEAILILVRSHIWQEALRVATLENRLDLVTTHIEPAVEEGVNERENDLDESLTKLEKYCVRLVELREERERQRIEDMDAFDQDMPRDADALSDTGSIQSGMSSYSGVSLLSAKSGASARSNFSTASRGIILARNKKKRSKLKKGSPFEEDNLVGRIYSLVPTKGQIASLAELLRVLVYFGLTEDAVRLTNKLKQVLVVIRKNRELMEKSYVVPSVDDQNVPDRDVTPRKLDDVMGVHVLTDENWTLTVL